jgi:hypothetical protein
MRRSLRRLSPLHHGILQRTMRLLEESFQTAIETEEPFVELHGLLKPLEDNGEYPFFDWSAIERVFEDVLYNQRTVQGAAYKAAMDITGLSMF